MNIFLSLFIVIVLFLLVLVGVSLLNMQFIFAVIFPYLALVLFIGFFTYRILSWIRSPVPFRIPTTCGQQKSLSWIKSSYTDSPHTSLGVFFRMVLEVLFFRSLFRNTKTGLKAGPRLVYGSTYYLWLGAIIFHWCFLVIFLRHYRFFSEPVPIFVELMQYLDSFFQIGVPGLYLTNIGILVALTYLFIRRVFDPKLRYISLVADYFPLFLISGIAVTGILLRYFLKSDIVEIKKLTMGLLHFQIYVPEGVGILFYTHLFFVCVLFAYFPFSKLMHMPGVFLSPTRNLANNNRMKRHVNPWDYPVKFHTYEEWEEEFKEKMIASGYDLGKE